MQINLDTFKHLLPSGRAWRITVDKFLRQFFDGLVSAFRDAQDYQDDQWLDVRPQDTTKLDEWEDQFGLIQTGGATQDRRDRLEAAWKALGGQDPRYLQDTVQAAGFDLYIHEWWRLPVSGSPDARNPVTLISVDGTGSFVINQLGKPSSQLGNPTAQLGESRPLGLLITDNLAGPPTEIPADSATWPFFLYFGGQTFGDFVQIPVEREAELKRLLLKLCPAQQWIGLFVEFV